MKSNFSRHFLIVVTLMLCLSEGSVGDTQPNITWWNVGKFLREFVNNGLGVQTLQDHLDSFYTWETIEVNGRETLERMTRRVSTIVERHYRTVQSLKRVIEQEYDNWEITPRHQIQKNVLCCEADELSESGCALLSKPDSGGTGMAAYPPLTVVSELKRAHARFQEPTTTYFAFNDGSAFLYPPRSKDQLLACKSYDPRLRYFFAQSKSPEPRDVMMVVNAGEGQNCLLREVVNRTLRALSPIDWMGLCIADDSNSCKKQLHPLFHAELKWPGEDMPLKKRSCLGRLIAVSKTKRDCLNEMLKSWLQNSNQSRSSFTGHVEALTAGLKLLMSKHTQPYRFSKEVAHDVLVYVTTREGWQNWQANPDLVRLFNESLNNNISIIINPVEEAARDLETSVLLSTSNANVKIMPYLEPKDLYSSNTSIDGYGLNTTNRPVIPMLYWDAFGDGYIFSVCLPLTKNGNFLGAACTDLSFVNVLEAETTVDDIEDAYVFIVNSEGNTIMHPLLPSPHSITDDPIYVTIDNLEQDPRVEVFLKDIVNHQSGTQDVMGTHVESIGRPRGTILPNAVRPRHRHLRYMWAPLNYSDLTITLVLPLNDEKRVISSRYKCPNDTACQTQHFQYNLAKLNDDSRKFCRFFKTAVVRNQALVKFAPTCFLDVLSYMRGEENERRITQVYDLFTNIIPYDELLREDLRASVRLMEEAEQTWRQEAPNLKKHIGTRYMGMSDGTFASYPGGGLKPEFDHRKRPWYLLAASTPEISAISLSTPYCDEWGAGMMYTITKPLYDGQSNPVGVVAGDFTLQFIMTYFLSQVSYCKHHTCFLVDRMGYVALKSNWVLHNTSPCNCGNNREIIAAHINRLAPDIARNMIDNNILRRRGCHDFERELTFYYWSVTLIGYRTLHIGPNYVIHKIPSTNLFLIARTHTRVPASCNCAEARGVNFECHDTCAKECECPCVSGSRTQPCHEPEADLHKHPLPACKPRGLTLVGARNYSQQELRQLDRCNNDECSYKDITSCSTVVWCLWQEGRCQHVDALC